MTVSQDQSARLQETVQSLIARNQSMLFVGHGSKRFLSNPNEDAVYIETADHSGVIDYHPDELVVTVRAGTPLKELQQVVGSHAQMLASDPPEYQGRGTVGGAVACGLSGPGRPWYGSLRDHILGIEVINGLGQRLKFGGQVIKNVAGFDVSRLFAGSMGTLGLILNVSFKLLPKPKCTRTIALSLSFTEAQRVMLDYVRRHSTLTGTCYSNERLYLRFSGATSAVKHNLSYHSGSEEVDPLFWESLRDHDLPFFTTEKPIWRVVLERGTSIPRDYSNHELVSEWNGSLNWIKTDSSKSPILPENGSLIEAFKNLESRLGTPTKYGELIKEAFDSHRLFNPGIVV